jgi:hypothetical protein
MYTVFWFNKQINHEILVLVYKEYLFDLCNLTNFVGHFVVYVEVDKQCYWW